MKCYIDLETRSDVDIQAAGGMRYAVDPTTEILCYAYQLGDAPVVSVIKGHGHPPELIAHIRSGGTMCAWNGAGFDFPVWNAQFGSEAFIRISQYDDLMDRSRAYGRPASLDKAARFLNLKLRKDNEGHKLMLKFCKASNPYPDDEEMVRLAEYCRKDVEVMVSLASLIPPLPDFEVPVMRLSHEINARGFMVDTELATRAVGYAALENDELCNRMSEITGGEVTRHTQRAKLLKWLNENGLKTPNIQKQTLEDILSDTTLDKKVREAINIRLSGAKASTAKFKAALNAVEPDGRIRGAFVYFGAIATGRWSGRILQPHNLPRETASDPYAVLEAIKNGKVKSVYKSLSTLLRPLIIARPGHSLVRCDFSAIEGRVVAWLANDRPALEEYAGEGKMYELAASKIYGCTVANVTKKQRQIGKVSELALSFGGAHDAFASMAKNYGTKVPLPEAKKIVKAWREGRPSVVALWKEVEAAASLAFRQKGKPINCCGGKVTFIRDTKDNMWIRLPSSRFICLPGFKVIQYEGPYGPAERLTYKRGNWTPAKGETEWPRADTYGGSLVESLAQGIARDLMAEAMLDLSVLDIVLHVHDEIVVECPDTLTATTLLQMEKVMSVAPIWANGLPLAAVGEISRRFGK